MSKSRDELQYRAHPWHGIPACPGGEDIVTAYIEITAHDPVKYELDKDSGLLKVDRPQRSSSLPPMMYGLVPRTYCGEQLAALAPGAEEGDADPLDICVLCETPISRGDFLVDVRIVGGMQMIDGGEADDKLIAVLEGDSIFSGARDIKDVPKKYVDQLLHYLTTYKALPGKEPEVSVDLVYGIEHARKVLQASIADYDATFG